MSVKSGGRCLRYDLFFSEVSEELLLLQISGEEGLDISNGHLVTPPLLPRDPTP